MQHLVDERPERIVIVRKDIRTRGRIRIDVIGDVETGIEKSGQIVRIDPDDAVEPRGFSSGDRLVGAIPVEKVFGSERFDELRVGCPVGGRHCGVDRDLHVPVDRARQKRIDIVASVVDEDIRRLNLTGGDETPVGPGDVRHFAASRLGPVSGPVNDLWTAFYLQSHYHDARQRTSGAGAE